MQCTGDRSDCVISATTQAQDSSGKAALLRPASSHGHYGIHDLDEHVCVAGFLSAHACYQAQQSFFGREVNAAAHAVLQVC